MVTVTNYFVRETKDGRTFIALELSGGLEFTQSQVTGKFYATTKRTSIPCTFDENAAKNLIGSQMPGEIVKQEVEPYEFTNKTNGETMLLNYSYSYQATPQAELMGSYRSELQNA